tara:strand:+ start:7192 stop:11190 length:3999 start_codon:yes stop_codon:yes gene_type:complete
MKKIIPLLIGVLFLGTLVFLINKQELPENQISDLKKQHKDFLNNSPFKETLEYTKAERKKNGLPPNKYYEERWELTMNPALGRPTTENLRKIQKELLNQRGLKNGAFAKVVPGEKTENSWIERGPNNVSGRARAVMFDPNDDTNQIVFAGGVSGGLWKNSNISSANSQWERVAIPENLAVSSLTYDPNNPDIFYMGTGESYVGGDVNGDGLWKSEDRGETWVKIFGGASGDSSVQTSTSNITINSPVPITGNINYQPTTSFGTALTLVITADVVLANNGTASPTLGCEAFTNSSEMAGKIALIRRGDCNFTLKAKNAQNAGAIAVIVTDNTTGNLVNMSGDDASITIPAVFISKANGDAIQNALSTEIVNVSLNPKVGVFNGLLVPGIQHINDVVVRNNAGVSEIYVAAGDSFYGDANVFTSLGGLEFGLYKSVDGGTNWVEASLPLTSNGNKYCPNDIEIGIDNKIWVATTNSVLFGDGGGTVLSSVDGDVFTNNYQIDNGVRTQISSSRSDAQKLYVLAEGSGNAPIILERTDDGFASTINLALPNDADTGIPANDFARNQAFYNLTLSVDPVDDNVVYTGGIDLFKSINAGESWNQISKWSNNNDLNDLSVPLVHADQHRVAYGNNDNSKVLFANDGGIYYSSNAGTTISDRNNGFITAQFYSIGVGPKSVFEGDYFIAGAQDNGTQIFQDAIVNAPDNSLEVTGGDGGYSFFDQDGSDAYFVANVFYNTFVVLYDYIEGEYIIINDEEDSNGSFINPQDLDSHLDILYSNYSSAGNSVIKRYSGIKSEATIVKTDLTDALLTSRPTAFRVSPYTARYTKLYVGTVLGDLLKVENADGDNLVWADISGSSFVGSVSDVEFGANENEIFVTMHNYGVVNIWFTNDGGASWQNKEGDLPDLPVNTILQNPLNYNEVIIGTDLGVWFTTNFSTASPEWNQAYNGMSNVKVTDMDVRDDNMVFASTYGRGVFSGAFELVPDEDIDGDGILNEVDNCPQVANADQADVDGNGIGDVCQDSDNDTILDVNDNCPESSNIDQIDTDGNGIGDGCQDVDDDGVIDIEDNCLITANPDQQDTNGNGVGDACDTSYENPDNISLEIVSETCEGSGNGKIIITTKETYITYNAILNGEGISLSEGFDATVTFENLVAGSYLVCVSVENTTFEQCFEINITPAAIIDVDFDNRVNTGSDTTTFITINKGTPPFDITFNGEIIRTTSEKSFEIQTSQSGVLEISSSKACEGKTSKAIDSNNFDKFTASPNPVLDVLRVTLPSINQNQIPVQIYNLSGQLLYDRVVDKGESTFVNIPFEALSKGVYFVKVNIGKPLVFKVFKK